MLHRVQRDEILDKIKLSYRQLRFVFFVILSFSKSNQLCRFANLKIVALPLLPKTQPNNPYSQSDITQLQVEVLQNIALLIELDIISDVEIDGILSESASKCVLHKTRYETLINIKLSTLSDIRFDLDISCNQMRRLLAPNPISCQDVTNF